MITVLEKLSEPASTMMACPDNTKTKQFIAANLGDAAMQRYNSRLPIVVYAPKDAEVKYRIWKAEDTVSGPSRSNRRLMPLRLPCAAGGDFPRYAFLRSPTPPVRFLRPWRPASQYR